MRLSKFLYFRKLSMQPFDPLRSVNQPGGESVTGETFRAVYDTHSTASSASSSALYDYFLSTKLNLIS